MNKVKPLVIFSLGIFVGIAALLFVSIVDKNGFIGFSQAAALPAPPVICYQCGINGGQLGIAVPDNRFAGVNFKDAYMPGVQTFNVNYSSSNFKNAILNRGQFGTDNFTGVKFINANMDSAPLVTGNNFTGADFTGAKLTNWQSEGDNNYTNANFTNADLTANSGVWQGQGSDTFTGATWSNTTCPDGTNSNSDGNTCVNNLNP